MNHQNISVIIATKNRYNDIINCIDSLYKQSVPPNEIIIVDSSDTRELEETVVELNIKNRVHISYIYSKPGLTYQRNIGVAASKGNIIFFFDDDVIIDKDYIKHILAVFQQDVEMEIGGACGHIEINAIESEKLSKNNILILFHNAFRWAISNAFFLPVASAHGKFRLSCLPTYACGIDRDEVTFTESVPGGITAYRKEVLDEFKFDENLSGYCWGEDDDFSYRVTRKYKNAYVPLARAIHNTKILPRGKRYDRMQMAIENHYYIFNKNSPKKLANIFAFYMSMIGFLIIEMDNTIISRDTSGLKGVLQGINRAFIKKPNGRLYDRKNLLEQ